jgi:hypothetical protein
LVQRLLTTLPLGDYFPPELLAAQMRRPLSWALEAIQTGELPARKVRGEWVISKDALDRYFRAQVGTKEVRDAS